MNVQGLARSMPDRIPHSREQFLARYDAAGFFGEDSEKIELLRGEIHHLSIACRPAAGSIHDDAAGRKAGFNPSPSTDCADARAQLADRERLDDVVVRSQFKTDDTIGLIAARGDDDDGNVGDSPKRTEDVEAIVIRESEIEQDDVCLPCRIEDLDGKPDMYDVESMAAQSVDKWFSHRRVVFNNQHSHASSSLRGSIVPKRRKSVVVTVVVVTVFTVAVVAG